jgi:hypothetical protein
MHSSRCDSSPTPPPSLDYCHRLRPIQSSLTKAWTARSFLLLPPPIGLLPPYRPPCALTVEVRHALRFQSTGPPFRSALPFRTAFLFPHPRSHFSNGIARPYPLLPVLCPTHRPRPSATFEGLNPRAPVVPGHQPPPPPHPSALGRNSSPKNRSNGSFLRFLRRPPPFFSSSSLIFLRCCGVRGTFPAPSRPVIGRLTA